MALMPRGRAATRRGGHDPSPPLTRFKPLSRFIRSGDLFRAVIALYGILALRRIAGSPASHSCRSSHRHRLTPLKNSRGYYGSGAGGEPFAPHKKAPYPLKSALCRIRAIQDHAEHIKIPGYAIKAFQWAVIAGGVFSAELDAFHGLAAHYGKWAVNLLHVPISLVHPLALFGANMPSALRFGSTAPDGWLEPSGQLPTCFYLLPTIYIRASGQ